MVFMLNYFLFVVLCFIFRNFRRILVLSFGAMNNLVFFLMSLCVLYVFCVDGLFFFSFMCFFFCV